MIDNTELIIKNDYSAQMNLKIIKMSLQALKLNMNDISKIIITEKVINFVTK